MPVRRYQVETYIESLLKKIGINLITEKDIDIYRDLVDYSVGFNPRTMKRFLNTLQLLMILENKRRKVPGSVNADEDTSELNRQRYVCRVTFAILCMIEKYECIYEYLTKDLSEKRMIELRDGIVEGESFTELREDLQNNFGVENVNQVHEFLSTFIECIDLDDDESISDKEMDHLNDMLSQTALVSSSHTVSQIDPREFAVDLKRELNSRYRHFFRSNTKWRYKKFHMSVGSVFLSCDRGGAIYYRMSHYEDSYYLELVSSEAYSFILGEIICERFGLTGERWPLQETEGEYCFVFIKQNVSEDDALKSFKSAVLDHFDLITKEQRFLFDSCGRALAVDIESCE